MFTRKGIISSILLFLLVFIMSWIGYHLTPPIWDDIYYHFQIKEDSFSNQFNTEWKDVWESLKNVRTVHNGRLANALFIIIAFCGSKHLLDIFNSIFLTGSIFMISLLCFRKISLWNICAVLFSLILIIPHPDRIFFWAASSFNYVLGILLCTSFLYYILKQHEQINSKKWEICLTALLAFFCGFIHEALGAPLLAGLICFYIYSSIKENSHCNFWLYFVCLFVGTCAAIISPGTLGRIAGASSAGSSFGKNAVYSSILCIVTCWSGLIIYSAALLYQFKWNRKHIFWLCLIIPNLAISCAFGCKGAWGGAYFYPFLMIVLFCLDKFSVYITNAHRYIKILIFLILSIILCYFYQNRAELHLAHARIINQAKNHAIVLVDCPKEPNWALIHSLPDIYDKGDGIPSLVYNFYHRHSFIPVFNVKVKDKTIYENQHLHFHDECAVFMHNDAYYIQAPRGHIISYHSHLLSATTEQGTHITLGSLGSTKYKYAHLIELAGQDFGIADEDYHNQHYYLIVPDKKRRYKNITFQLVNLQTGHSYMKTIPLK